MIAEDDGRDDDSRSITCHLTTAFSTTNYIGSPSSATMRVHEGNE